MSAANPQPDSPRARRARLRADRALRQDYERLKTETLSALRGRLARSNVRVDPTELDAGYNLAWHALHAKLAAGEEIANPGGFLTQAAFFRIIDQHRRQHLERRTDVDPDLSGTEPDIDQRLDDSQRLRAFSQGLRTRLDDRECRAAALCYLHGYSRAEAATILGVPPSRMDKIMDRVSGVVRELAADIRDRDWCATQRSLITAYALGVLDPEGPRHAVAADHLETCSGCRARVRRLRGIGAIVPPIALPWGTIGIEPLQVPATILHGTGPLAAPPGPSAQGPRARTSRSIAAALAVLAILAIVAVALVTGSDGGNTPATGHGDPTSAASGPPGRGSGASAPDAGATPTRVTTTAAPNVRRSRKTRQNRRRQDVRRSRGSQRRAASPTTRTSAPEAVPTRIPTQPTVAPAPTPKVSPTTQEPAARPTPVRDPSGSRPTTDAQQEFGIEP